MIRAVKRFLQYSSVGFSTFLFDLLIVFLLTHFFNVQYLWAVGIGFLIGVSLNYLISRVWVFKGTKRTLHHGYLYFIGGATLSLSAILLFVGLLVGTLGVPLLVARIFVSGVVGCGSYLFNLYINFKVAGTHH